jgi:hypothetical protein
MKPSFLKIPFFIFALFFAFQFSQPVFAHGGVPRIEVGAERLNAGSALDIRGVNFEAGNQIHLSLVSPENELSLGSVVADIQGVFLLTITLPVDLPAGTYVIRAKTNDHDLDSPQITVSGSADPGEGQGQRDEEEPLLAPVPTIASGIAVTPVVVAQTLDTPSPSGSIFQGGLVLVVVSVLFVLIFVILILRRQAV